LAAIAVLGVATADAERVREGNLDLVFNASFEPRALPRDHPVPVTVRLSGSVRTADGSRPPRLRRMSIAVNRYGVLSTAGLPVCPQGRLESTSSAAALERCGRALVGRGTFRANVDLPNLRFPVKGRMLAFNSRAGGDPAIALHVYGTNPAKATVVLGFRIRRTKGELGTVLSAKIPNIAADLGYVTDISLFLGRRYRHGGRPRSFLSARCAAPAGFPGALFPFARGSFAFANGQTLSMALWRNCRVR
jgi:hypothetical protein